MYTLIDSLPPRFRKVLGLRDSLPLFNCNLLMQHLNLIELIERDPNVPESLKAILRRRQEEADQAKWESMKEDQQYDKFVKQQEESS